jgi:hypothetical protein
VQVVILERRGSSGGLPSAASLFPAATICAPEELSKSYSSLKVPTLFYPSSVRTLGELRQCVLDQLTERVVVFVPARLNRLLSFVGLQSRTIQNADDVAAIIERTAICATDAGAKLFGLRSRGSPSQHSNLDFLSFTTAPHDVVGVIGRDVRFDPSLSLLADIDAALTSLRKDRIVWVDQRFKVGTSSPQKPDPSEDLEAEIEYLQDKWRRFVTVKRTKRETRIEINVKR